MSEEQFQIMQELMSAQYIQLCRLYDVMLIIGDKLGANTVDLKEMHEQGRTFSPYPSLIDDSEDENA
jgi:4-hydroxy-3-methylbut-2-enyl diphosphate reductase IspH